jgi:ATP-binding cassette subfamily B protein
VRKVKMSKEKANRDSRERNPGLFRLLRIAGEKKWKLVASSALSVISALFGLALFVLVYFILKELVNPPVEQSYVWRLAWLALAAVVLRYVFFVGSTMLSHIAAFDILYNFRMKMVTHLARLPMGYFNRRTAGGIKKIMNEDVERVELFVAHHIPDLAAAIALPVVTLIFLFILDWRLALAALIPLPLAFVSQLAMYGGEKRVETMKKWHDSMEAMNGIIVEYVRGMPVIKVFNQTVYSFRRFRESVYSYRDWMVKASNKMAPPWGVFMVLASYRLVVGSRCTRPYLDNDLPGPFHPCNTRK